MFLPGPVIPSMDDDGFYEKNYVLEYSDFHGSPTDDVEFFLRDFEAITQYNEQSTDEEKLRILPGLLKKRALTWYKSLPAEETQDWTSLRAAFVKQFRRNPHKLLTKLSRIKKKPEETVRKYSIRVAKLINKVQLVDEPYPERVKVWWFLKGLPTSVRKYCLHGEYATMEAAIATAKIYESSALTPREELRGRTPDGLDDADLNGDYSDVESCTSVGTFISSVAESVDLKPKKVLSTAGIKKDVQSPWDKKVGTGNDRPLTGVSRSGQKVSKNMNVVGDFKHGKRPPMSPPRQICAVERLLTMNLNEPHPSQRRKSDP